MKKSTIEKEYETTVRVKNYKQYEVESKSKLMEFIKNLTFNKTKKEEIAVILPNSKNGNNGGFKIITHLW